MLRALIKIPIYKHGVRSLEAIIDMSMLNGRTCWEQACLPAKAQLKLHVDEEMFFRLVVRDVLFGAAREELAKAIHKKYLKDQEGIKPASDDAMQPWEKLNISLQESNRKQADHIPEKLHRVGCGFGPVKKETIEFEFSQLEIEILAEMEHERWISERMLDGWVYSEKKDVEKKISPYLVPWNELTEEVKEWDRLTVRGMPEIMKMAGFEIYRM